jgi:hypothetical protein
MATNKHNIIVVMVKTSCIQRVDIENTYVVSCEPYLSAKSMRMLVTGHCQCLPSLRPSCHVLHNAQHFKWPGTRLYTSTSRNGRLNSSIKGSCTTMPCWAETSGQLLP